MSYVRISNSTWPGRSYDSDIYIYDDVSGGITCFTDDFNCETHDEMIAHVKKHIADGDAVPDFVIPRLKAGQNFNWKG